jgi:ABC-type sugar transport system ATPase subunit
VSLLEIEQLVVRRGRTPVVEGVDLTVERGEVVAVLGPNGAGKSTLLAAIGGLLPTHSGRVTHEGRVASVLQAPGLANRSVRANVEAALGWWGVPRSERRPRAIEALTHLHAEHLATRHAATLSGGERRRVHVARGVALRPDLLLLDEPFAGLDPGTRAALCEDTSSALRESAGGVVVVVHDRDEAWALADRLVVMLDGRIAATGAPGDLLAAPPSIEVARFLGYDGELRRGDRVLLTRAPDVVVGEGDLTGTVTRLLPQQDGVRLEVTTADGSVRAQHPGGLRIGDSVRLRLVGGVDFARPADRPGSA